MSKFRRMYENRHRLMHSAHFGCHIVYLSAAAFLHDYYAAAAGILLLVTVIAGIMGDLSE